MLICYGKYIIMLVTPLQDGLQDVFYDVKGFTSVLKELISKGLL
jgi:hypothetical protein